MKRLTYGLTLAATFCSAVQADVIGKKPWTTIGSAGTTVSGQVINTSGTAFLDGPSAVLIYNVVAVNGLQAKNGVLPVHPIMIAKFRDNGANNHVIVRLRRVNLANGQVHNMITIDSNNYAGSSSFQTREVGCGNNFTFDFSQYAFFVEVTMTRTGLPVTPAIASVQLGTSSSPCLVAPGA